MCLSFSFLFPIYCLHEAHNQTCSGIIAENPCMNSIQEWRKILFFIFRVYVYKRIKFNVIQYNVYRKRFRLWISSVLSFLSVCVSVLNIYKFNAFHIHWNRVKMEKKGRRKYKAVHLPLWCDWYKFSYLKCAFVTCAIVSSTTSFRCIGLI